MMKGWVTCLGLVSFQLGGPVLENTFWVHGWLWKLTAVALLSLVVLMFAQSRSHQTCLGMPPGTLSKQGGIRQLG